MGNSNIIYKNSLLYTIGNLLLKAFSFFLIPLYTTFLTTDDYGITNLVTGFTGVVSCIITLSFQYAVIRFYADVKDDKQKSARLFGTVISFILCYGAIICLILIFSQGIWSPILFEDIPFIPIGLMAILNSLVVGLYAVYQDILKGMQDAKRSVNLSFVFFFLLLLSNLLTIAYFKLGALGMVLSSFVVHTVMTIFMIFDLNHRKLLIFCIDRKLIKALFVYSLPLVPHTMAYKLSQYATKLIINSKLSLSTLGLYGLSSQFGNISDIIQNSFQNAFQPWMFGILNDKKENASAQIRSVTYSILWGMGVLYLLIGLFCKEAIILMSSSSYHTAWRYVPPIIFAVAIKSPLYFYYNYLYYYKDKTKYIFSTTLFGCVVNVFFTFLMVPLWGIYGSIGADIIALICRLLLVYKIVNPIMRGTYSFWKLHLICLVPILFMIIALVPSYMSDSNEWLGIGFFVYKLVVLLLYVLFVLYTNKGIANQLKKIIAYKLRQR